MTHAEARDFERDQEEGTSRADGLEELERAELDPHFEELAHFLLGGGTPDDVWDCEQRKHLLPVLKRTQKAHELMADADGDCQEIRDAMKRALMLPDCPWCEDVTLELDKRQLVCRCPKCGSTSPKFPDTKTMFPNGERNPAAVRRFLLTKYK